MDLRTTLNNLIEKKNLSFDESRDLFDDIMDGKLLEAQTAAFLVALRMKEEIPDEIAGAAYAMRKRSKKVVLDKPLNDRIVDTCGTGGDMTNTFNVSTCVALTVASCGVPIAKHGNRSVSSKCGSADILKALGVKVELEPEGVKRCIEDVNFGFMFAPIFHPAMANVMGVRRALGVRTIFNVLGPLTNPAGAKRQLIGVFSADLTEKVAEVLLRLGTKSAIVVHGEDGMDEVTLTGFTKVTEVNGKSIKTYTVYPEDFGFKRTDLPDLSAGKTIDENIEIVRSILKGEDNSPKTDMVLLNSGFALYASGTVRNIKEGISMARNAVGNGRPYDTLIRVVECSNR